jgi:flagellar FliL protein
MSDEKQEDKTPAPASAADAAAATAAPATPAAANAAKPAASALPVMLGGAIGALIAGAALGLFVVGPRVVAARAHAPAPAARQESAPAPVGDDKGGKGDKGDKGGAKVKPTLYKVDNIIVNPAGAQGSHFLMASVVFEVPDDKVEERLRDHEVQVRDVVVSVLESKSMDDLIRPGARDRLKVELATLVKPMAGNAAWIHVYLPQFVIQ